MSIAIDDAKLYEIIAATVGATPSAYEGRAVIEAMQLAAYIGLDDVAEENRLLRDLTARLCAIAGVEPAMIRPLSPVPADPEERTAYLTLLNERLMSSGVRELAFGLAYLVVVADQALAPVESDLLQAMQRSFAIPDERAAQLVALTSRLVTPGLEPDPGVAGSMSIQAQ